jgi:hypothetical protein
MTFGAVGVTLRVGAGAGPDGPPRPTSPLRGGLPVTGASLFVLATVALVMVVLGIMFLVHARQENR